MDVGADRALLRRPGGARSERRHGGYLAAATGRASAALMDELNTWYSIATTVNTADTEDAGALYQLPRSTFSHRPTAAEQRLKEKLLASGLEPAGFAVPLRKMRTDAALYREANVPLLADLRKLDLEYDGITGARTVHMGGRGGAALARPARPARSRPRPPRARLSHYTRAHHPGYAAVEPTSGGG